MKKFQHSLSIGADTWHAKWYRYWLSFGGKEPEYKENLCHYVRVLLFWAPLKWFLRGSLGKVNVRPYALVVFAVVVAAIAGAFTFATAIALKGLLLLGILLVVGILFSLAGLVTEEFGEGLKQFAAKIGKPFGRPFVWIGDKIGDYVVAVITWFFQGSYLVKPLTPFTTLILMALVAWGIVFTKVFLIFWAGITVIALGTFILCLAFYGILELDDWFKSRESYRPGRFKRFIGGSADTIKLGATYANTRKQGSRICPFIDLQDPETEPSS